MKKRTISYKNVRLFGLILIGSLVGTAQYAAVQQNQMLQPRAIPSSTRVLSRPIPAAAKNFKLGPGFQGLYDAVTGAWHWQYGQIMATGCDTLVYAPNPVQLDGSNHFIISLLSYRSDDHCTIRAVAPVYLRGSVNADAMATFSVNMDGKRVSN
jgi:hypothetical protein